jgi:hypothetical protein
MIPPSGDHTSFHPSSSLLGIISPFSGESLSAIPAKEQLMISAPLLLVSLKITHDLLMIRFFCPIQSRFPILRTLCEQIEKDEGRGGVTLFSKVALALHFSIRKRTILKFPLKEAKCNEVDPFWEQEEIER